MADGRLLLTSMSAGEFSARAQDRRDLAAYFQGAAKLTNLLPTVEGALVRAMGTQFVAEVKENRRRTRLIPFTKSDQDTIMIEAGAGYFRYFDGEGLLRTLGGVETPTPYAEVDLDRLYWSQSADVMFLTLTNSAKKPRALRRFSDTNWSLIEYDAVNGPFLAREGRGSLNPTATGPGASTLITAGVFAFDSRHVGARFRLWQPLNAMPYEAWAPESEVVTGRSYEYLGRVYSPARAGTTSRQPPVHEGGTAPDSDAGDAVRWTYQHELAGIVRITSVTNAAEAVGVVETRLPSGDVTDEYAEGAFSDVNGWPKLVGIVQGRLFFASTDLQPDTIYMSRIDGFTAEQADFKQSDGNGTVEDDHAVVRTMSHDEVNAPGWAIVDEFLVLGTPRGLIRITGPSVDEPITPAAALANRIPGTAPAASECRGILAGDSIVYASVGQRKLFDWSPDYGLRNLTLRADHVGFSPIRRVEWAGEPYNRLYALREDGRLYCAVIERNENVLAWCELRPGGAFEGGPALVDDIAVLKDGRGLERLWMIVRRTIGGEEKRHIERINDDWRADAALPDEANYLSAARSFNNWKTANGVMRVVADGDARAGDTVRVNASIAFAFLNREGQELHVRRRFEVEGRPAAIILRLRVDRVLDGSRADCTLLTDPDPDGLLVNANIGEWGFAFAELTVLGHLEGEEIAVMGDGMDFGRLVVSNGHVTLPSPAVRVWAGLATAFLGRSLKLAVSTGLGTGKGKVMSLTEGYVSLIETGPEAVEIRVIEDGRRGKAQMIGGRTRDDLLGAAPAVGDISQRFAFSSRGGRDLAVEIAGDGPFPVTLTSITMEYRVE